MKVSRNGGDFMPQSLAKVYIHAVFSTKNRLPVLAEAWRDELYKVLGGATNNLACQSLLVGGVEDHVHILFQLGRTISLADAIGKMKSNGTNGTSGIDHGERPFQGRAWFGVLNPALRAGLTE